MQRHDGEYPHNARDADADGGDDKRHERIADAAQAAAVHLDRDIQQVPRHDVIDYAHGERYNVLVGREDHKEVFAERQEQRTYQNGKDRGHYHAVAYALAHALHAVCAEILPDEGHYRKPHRAEHQPCKGVDLAHGDPCRGSVRTEAVDGCEDYHVGDRVEHCLKPRGQADVHGAAHDPPVRAQLGKLKPDALLGLRPGEKPAYHHCAQQLRERRRDRCARDAHFECDDEQQVEHHIYKAAGNEKIQRVLGITDRAQDSGAHVVDHAGDHRHVHPAHIHDGVGHRVLRRFHDAQQRRRCEDTNNGHYGAARDGEDHRRVHRARGVLHVASAVILRDDDCRARGDAGEEADKQIEYLRGRAADRSQRLLADKAADNDRVNGVVKLLEKCAEEHREEEQHQLLPDNTLGDPVIF